MRSDGLIEREHLPIKGFERIVHRPRVAHGRRQNKKQSQAPSRRPTHAPSQK
jgi:hypothetical protein